MSANPSTRPAVARRAVVAVAVPTTLAALLCTANLAGTAFASGSTSTTATPCSTSSATPTGSAPTTGAPTATPTGKPTTAPAPTATTGAPTKAPISAPSTAPAGQSAPSSSPTPTASPTATGSGDGFWGWLNGVWQWIFDGAQQLTDQAPQVAAAAAAPLRGVPLGDSGSSKTSPAKPGGTKPGTAKKSADSGTSSTPADCATSTAAPLHKDEAAPPGNDVALIPWHLATPSMTMYGLTFNGVDTVQTANGPEQVMDFTALRVEIKSMVTYSYPGGASGPRQYNNAGDGTTTVLTDIELWTTTMTASILGLQVTLTPTAAITTILGVAQGFTIPIPIVFTDVNADNALLSAGGLDVPGFTGYSGS